MDKVNKADNTGSTPKLDGSSIIADEALFSYFALYFMALLSMLIGCFRSSAIVRHHVEKNRKMDKSITIKDFRSFPVQSSITLCILYLFFKHDVILMRLAMYTIKGAHYAIETLMPYNDVIFVDKLIELNNMTINKLTTIGERIGTDLMNSTMANATAASGWALFGKHTIRPILRWITCLLAITCMSELAKPFVQKLIVYAPKFLGKFKENIFYEVVIVSSKTEDFERPKKLGSYWFDRYDIYGSFLCIPIIACHLWKNHWITNNLIGLALSVTAIGSLHVSSFKAGVALSCGLFVYDIFWVFGTEVMVTVASNIDAPVLLKFPRNLLQISDPLSNAGTKFAILGLGDIIVPGIFIALLLRFGESRQKRRYFYSAVFAYAAGLFITTWVMHVFKAGQPALLYLVPLCVGIPTLVALISGELHDMITYNEDHLVQHDDGDVEDESDNSDAEAVGDISEESKKRK
ncbi:Intramembrane protease 2 [Trichinella sp. T6]|nr:Intramembrane protease 2 [Trichinella sp. T6]